MITNTWLPTLARELAGSWSRSRRRRAWGAVERRLLGDFDAGRMPAGGFDHRAHVHVAWMYLSLFPPARAIERFAAALRRFARAQGNPDLYNETVTWAYLLLIRERMAAGSAESFDVFAARNPDLLRRAPSVLERYYAPSTLESPLGRRVFRFPDRCDAGADRGDR